MSLNKMWTLVVELSMNQWTVVYPDLYDQFSQEMWDWILENCQKQGIY